MEKISFDNFTINIDISGNLEFSTKFLFQVLFSNVVSKLHIINYTPLDIEKIISKCKEEVKSDSQISEMDFQDKIKIVKNISKNIPSIEEYAKSLTKNEYLLIIGGERLLNYSKTKPIFKMKYFDLKTQLHFMEEENWVNFAEEVDGLFARKQDKLQGIVINISADSSSRKVILEALKDSNNMSITCVELLKQNEEYEKLQKDIFSKFENTSLKEILRVIENQKTRLDSITYNYMVAMAYLHHGDVSATINILETNFASLRNEEKIILSDLLIVTGQKERSKEILKELFQTDKYQKGLIEAILRLHEKSDVSEQKKWIDIALEIDSLNPNTLEFYGNWLSHNKKYIEAAKVFRQLRDTTKSPYYELVARMNDLLNSPSTKARDAAGYIYNVIVENPELKNEAKFRLANFFISSQESLMPAYLTLKSADFDLGKPLAVEIAKLKIDILSDVFKASKALRRLKPYSKERDAERLSDERSKELVACIPILATTSNGYLFWRSFIDKCQTDSSWKEIIFNRLIECLTEVSKIDYSSELAKSKISIIEKSYETDLKQYQGIILLRRVKSSEFCIDEKFNSLDEFIEVSVKYGEVYGDTEYKLWCRYYLSIILSLRGEHQLANNWALSILEYYPRIGQEHKILCIYLGLLAWGNSQYRIGRQVEGVACVISVFQLAKRLSEFYPLVEEGVNIIIRFIFDNKNIIPKSGMTVLRKFYNSLREYNRSLRHMWPFVDGSSENLIRELEKDIKESSIRDTDWAGKLTNLIAAYMENKMEGKAIELLNIYSDEAIEKLSSRMDVRYNIIFNWAQIYFYNVSDMHGIKKAINLLDRSIADIEERRKVYYKEERASIGEASDRIYRFYLQICSIAYGLRDIDKSYRKEILKRIEIALPRISPRSIIEQKSYNTHKEITLEMEQMKERLYKLREEYNNLYLKNSKDYELLSQKGEEIQKITEKLKKNHPYYMSLNSYNNVKFQDIQISLQDEEIFYQYFITPMLIVTLIISKDIIMLRTKSIANEGVSVEKLSKDFGLLIQQGHEDKNVDIEHITFELSRLIADELIDYVCKNKVKRVYVMQDYKMGLFPLIVASVNNVNLIDKVTSIINVIDYSVIGQKQKYETNSYKIGNRIFGHQMETSIGKINNWLESKKNESFLVMENKSDDVEEIMQFTSNSNVNTMIIYGHGVPDPKASLIDGAQGVEGQKKLIRLGDILDNLSNIRNFMLISCRGGSPYSNSAENSSGSWADIFEKFCGNIVCCKWDVPTDSTIFIINEMLDLIEQNNLQIDEALVIAQRKSKAKCKNPMYWAGIQFWMN